ncbi:cytochrome b5 [Coniochaeta ligniaria NRRL 30616]|uniref:Cytochrome b5 n=1 Tax=Coniochaeta ligniaria NRRL 30616 TaxID=1408157 RepID=A0A1J7IKB2_9PEZI|nr:cytochrome b5 [Coniochaeta ligniaria NRRL 30616]
MADTEPTVRQRKPKTTANDASDSSDASEPELVKVKTVSPTHKLEKEDAYNPIVDIFRVLTFLFVASCGLSYLISGGETWTWGMKNPPKYLQKDWWESQWRGPLHLTPAQLSAYDGTDETKPIYLAINGTIYDVSANRRTYGPGGSYHFFAGRDASRAYVTGCFAEDTTPDMRGAEEMYLPLDDPEVDRHWTAEQLRELRKKERAEAKRRVHEALKHWVDFFAKSKKYRMVGYVVMEEGWKKTTPRRKLCDSAQQGRTKRKIPGQEEFTQGSA